MLHPTRSHKLATIIITLATFALPTLSSAQTTAAELSAQLQQLQAQLAAMKVGGSTATTPMSSASCPTLARTLARSATGSDVTALQKFLIARGLLTSDSATGFFGALTEAAVQKFQASKTIVSSGTPATTGYGLVGAKTRAAIGLACTHTNSSANSSTNAPAPSSAPKSAPASSLQPQCPLASLPIGKSCAGQWKEVKDTKGCTASWECAAR